jgi:hypothetical protein
MKQDAEEAFAKLIPYIRGRYPFIAFDSAIHPSRNNKGDYYVVGAYEGKFLGIFPETKFLTLLWGKTDYPRVDTCDDFLPSVRFSDSWSYEFGSLGELEKLLTDNIKQPKRQP